MNKRIGFIGCGNMGKSMVMGLLKSKSIGNEDILVSTRSNESKEKIEEEIGVKCTLNNVEVAKFSDIIFLAVKPNMYKNVIFEIKDNLKDNAVIITIAAGIELKQVETWFGKDIKIIKTMPNTPALVGEGMSAICPNKLVKEEELNYVCNLYKSFGEYEILAEKDFHGFIALCGSSPAYVFMFIEAMADAAVKLGIPRSKAYKMAAQSVLGSAKMVLETKKHPGELKDMVCSPGGTTIDAVVELENQGFRNSVIKGMEKCAEKSKSM
ncbi:pyrroline-5-carboxylate reductase [Clostridium septicum]|uniref:Pyrroline-5-carboxylate reductase n=1 Tax=Clostridium septicum TaxID=1504 RepID=A0A9N7PKQ3_CLOSE|nr:pyrroline-5-carboxylate reductase [Clostridium septicum]AYE34302.1 pyrroline-5-carboxylate reductase [Clostridium septicum]QAS59696.1 pyrroline-5-carboxylate reductase [Clostridium septicum]UEC21060.1 pyrroline-5-carboxylate reductase [Clostridium septicum]USS00891.1 pyrroline-5-carboxylate reductase [Clostridium septicum]WLF69439.1 pyrroline-5-carboxylate reductase [Clostridium septicum]